MASICESELNLSDFNTLEQYDGQQLYNGELNHGQLNGRQLYNTQLDHEQLNGGQLFGEQPNNEIMGHFGTCQAAWDGLDQLDMNLSINNFPTSVIMGTVSQIAFGDLGGTPPWHVTQSHVQDPDVTETTMQREAHENLMISYPYQEGYVSNTHRLASDSRGDNHHNVTTSPWPGYPEDIPPDNFDQHVSPPYQRMNGSQEHTTFPPIRRPQTTDYILWGRDTDEMWIFDNEISPDPCLLPESEHDGHQHQHISSVHSQPEDIVNVSQELSVPRVASPQQSQPYQLEQQLTKRNNLSHSLPAFPDVDAPTSIPHCLSHPTAVPERKRTRAKSGICDIGKDRGDLDFTMKKAKTGTKSRTNFQNAANSKMPINLDNIKMYRMSDGSFGEIEATRTEQTNGAEEERCTLCRLTADTCTKRGQGRCFGCQQRYNEWKKKFGTTLPILKENSFPLRQGWEQAMAGLSTFLDRDIASFEMIPGLFVCHFEALQHGQAPCKFSPSSYPIAFRKDTTETNYPHRDLTFSLDRSSMCDFMLRFTKGWLSPKLGSIYTGIEVDYRNKGAISIALQFVLWDGILLNLEDNRIFRAEDVSAAESRRCLSIILSSIGLTMCDLVAELTTTIAESGNDSEKVEANLCAVSIMYRFLNAERKSSMTRANALTLSAFGETMCGLQKQLAVATELLLPILSEYRMEYGAYFCSTHKRDTLEYHVKLIDLQKFMFPLVNITIEKHDDRALSPLGLSPRIRGPQSFAQVMELGESEDSVLGECLKSLHDKFHVEVIPAPTKAAQRLKKENLEELQCSLAHCRSPKNIHYLKAAVSSSCGFLARG